MTLFTIDSDNKVSASPVIAILAQINPLPYA